ncbi:hypothetical protein FCU45_03135 [Sulfurimonas crateris]|uniref:Uncharacterized protein n=1 Tax=Sulfurimonas crateris TaxID=2574727 RepID=A0A4U2Z9K2_9BACT|nr:hypothetical protein [Sulfurimonas crateris]TKI70292.1 hypothetical protein FCU45_03135 [Sulfurimonas crateris]
MDTKRDPDNHRNNQMYYNQIVREKSHRQVRPQNHELQPKPSFTSQKVELSDHLFVIEGYEGIFYTLYFFAVPYITGAIFLFFFIAGGNYDNFMLLDMNAFLIVWLIGYEIAATLILIAIFISFFRYDRAPKKKNRHPNRY